MILSKRSRRHLRRLPLFPALDMFGRENALYKRSLACRWNKKPTCWGCPHLEFVSNKCDKFDTKNAYAYLDRYEFRGGDDIYD